MSLDIRFLPEQDSEEIIRQKEEAAGTKVKIHSLGDAVKTKVDDEYVINLSEAVKDILGASPEVFGQHGSADTRFYLKNIF